MIDPNTKLPLNFKRRVANTHGDKGLAWLNELPNLVKYAENTYNLLNTGALSNLSFNYITSAIQENGQSLILKFCLPGTEADNEIDALSVMRGDSIVRLIDYDRKLGILLLEECRPGKTLATVDSDIDATFIAANIIKEIQKPALDDNNFPTTRNWFSRLYNEVKLPSGFYSYHIDRAKSIARELHEQSNIQVLLHGDLHHFNILSSEKPRWLAIDPKGVIGSPEYECGAFLRNPIPKIAADPNLKKILAHRVGVFSETLGFDSRIILGWGYSQAILASVWCIDMKSENWCVFLKCAEALYELLNQAAYK